VYFYTTQKKSHTIKHKESAPAIGISAVKNAALQPASCIDMLNFMYLWFPLILTAIITVLLYFLKVEQANAQLNEAYALETSKNHTETDSIELKNE